MRIIINVDSNGDCPPECDYYDNEYRGHLEEYCYHDGPFDIRKGRLVKCPIGIWGGED